MRLSPIIAIALVPLFLAACGPGNKQGTGTVVGAVAGGAVGAAIGGKKNRIGGLAIGAMAGGLLGNLVGADMDKRDRELAAAAQYQALERGNPGVATAWNNPANQHHGRIVPGKPYQQGNSFCRPYTHTIYVSGQPQTARGTACRGPDGTWKTVG
jgi:surface antigen